MQGGAEIMMKLKNIYRHCHQVFLIGSSECTVANLAMEFIAHLKKEVSEKLIYDIRLKLSENTERPIFSFRPIHSSKDIRFSIHHYEHDFYHNEMESNEERSFFPLLRERKPGIVLIFLMIPTTGYNNLLQRLDWYFMECKQANVDPVFCLMGIENLQPDSTLDWHHERQCCYIDFLFLLLFKADSLPSEIATTCINERIKIACRELRDFGTMHCLKLDRKKRFYKMFRCLSATGDLNKQMMHTIVKLILAKDKFFTYHFENQKKIF